MANAHAVVNMADADNLGRVARVDDPWDQPEYRKKLQALYRRFKNAPKAKLEPADIDELREYDWLFGQIKESEAADNQRGLMRKLKEHYSLVLENDGSFSAYLTVVASAVRFRGNRRWNRDIQKKVYDRYNKAAQLYKGLVEEKVAERTVRPEDLSYRIFVQIREEYKTRFEDAAKAADRQCDPLDYWRFFVMALYTMQPPLRLDWGEMFVRTNNNPVGDTKVYLDMRGDNPSIVVLKDKVSKSKMFMSRKRITVTPELSKVLRQSLELFPRDYVVAPMRKGRITRANKPIGRTGLHYFIKRECLRGVKKPVHKLRSAFATYVHGNPEASFREMRDTAVNMRHSLMTAMLYYRKAHTGDDGNLVLNQQVFGGLNSASAAEVAKLRKDVRNAKDADAKEKAGPYIVPANHVAPVTDQAKRKRTQQYAEYKAGRDKAKFEQAAYLRLINKGIIRNPRDATVDRLKVERRDDGTWRKIENAEPASNTNPGRRGRRAR